MWSISNLKERGRNAINLNYWKCVLVGIILSAIASGGFSSSGSSIIYGVYGGAIGEEAMNEFFYNIDPIVIGTIVSFVVLISFIVMIFVFLVRIIFFNPLEVGARRFFSFNQQKPADIKELAFAFDNSFKNVVKIMFFRDLYIFLWSLLFVIPGIVKSYEYRMVPYILSENPELDKEKAFAISKQLMDGEKWKAFLLDLSFIGWWILSAFTGGILAIFYVQPYYEATSATLFEALKYIKFGQGASSNGEEMPE
ncbi:MAG: DUF975 family protein [Lachnospiraceae bacterium]|nr:DUF975 family protein [Lachnospiraceae bacterium]